MSDETGPCGVPVLLTVDQAAEIAQVRPWTIWNWVNSGRLPKVQPGGPGTTVRIRLDDLTRATRGSQDDTDEPRDD